MKKLFDLFSELFRISLFVIGGGYSILVVADRRFAKLGWIEEGELVDRLPVFQSIPGLIASHTAVYIGRKRAGAAGAAVGVAAVAIPAIAVFTVVSICYKAIPLGSAWLEGAFIGLRAALTGIIAATVIRSWRKSLPDAFAYALMTAALLAVGYFGLPIAPVLGVAAVLGSAGNAHSRRFHSSWLALPLFLQYGAFCLGGGFVIVPMYLGDFVGAAAPYLQIPECEFGDIMALSQITPGPIGVNCATFFGYRLAGLPGAFAASVLLLLPGSVMVYCALSSLEKFSGSAAVAGIMRGIRPASIALMLVALSAFAEMTVMPRGSFNVTGLLLLALATVFSLNRGINVVLLIFACAAVASLSAFF